MNIDDLLYYLRHPASLALLERKEIDEIINKYPYLVSLQSNSNIKSTNQPAVVLDSFQILENLAHQEFKRSMDPAEIELFKSVVFDLKAKQELTPIEDSIGLPDQAISKDPFRPQPESPTNGFPLYDYIPSGFISFLQSLKPSESHEIKEKLSSSNQSETDRLIQESVLLQSDIFSESLADLWASQGKKEDAIEMYNKLLLVNPEKNAIFAAKINKLKAENII